MRIPDDILNAVVYLYGTEQNARDGIAAGGSGFLVSVPSLLAPARAYVYVVTNRHVLNGDLSGGNSVIRFNTADGAMHVVVTDPLAWTQSESDDLAVLDLRLGSEEYNKLRVSSISTRQFLQERDISTYGIGPGTEVFMVGRFMGYEGRQTNEPAARFGRLSVICAEPIQQGNGNRQESYLVEMHSLSGYSGSPVVIYANKYLPGTGPLLGADWIYWLLGVDWGHLSQRVLLSTKTGEQVFAQMSSGIAGVVPAQRLLVLLNSQELAGGREREEERMRLDFRDTGAINR